MILRAIRPVLHDSKQYRPGDKLPEGDAGLADDWVMAGAAYWCEDEDKPKAAKARPAAAQAGRPGLAVPRSEEDLAGKLPKRKTQSEPAKRPGRKKNE